MDAGTVQIPSAIKGANMERVLGQKGNIKWQLDQLRGLKHPDDIPPAPAALLRSASTIRLDRWPHLDNGQGEISAWFTVDWQFNGKSVGNVQIANAGATGTTLTELSVEARIEDDPVTYPQSNPTHAAVLVTFKYLFRATDGSNDIAKATLHLMGDGNFEQTSVWERL
jgi:hypothetical protein